MKIAILSMQRVLNTGSVLQAYSLKSILRELGADSVEFLDIDRTNTLPSKKTIQETDDYVKAAEFSHGFHQRVKNALVYRQSKYNKNLLRGFMQDELKLDAAKHGADYDCVIVGSDEVFNHAQGINLQLHGEVPQGKKVISYAAACGSARIHDIEQEHLEQVREAMGHFAAVSVRDAATKDYASALYSGKIERHLDPVLVGPLRERKPKRVPVKNYLLVYAYGHRIRTKEEIEAIRAFAKAKKLKVIAVGGSQVWCDRYIPASPMRVLDYFHYADYVVTDTFHGAIFSVINQKKFGVIIRKTNQAKLSGLLSDLGLQDREVKDICHLEQTLTADVDYDRVNEILKAESLRTRAYLKEQLSGSAAMEKIELVKDIARCSGCGACLAACPKGAIQMKPDSYGCLYPEINRDLCIGCGKCVGVCAYQIPQPVNTPREVYAAVGNCDETVAQSASGGVFATLAHSCIQKGGVVAGAVLDCEDGQADVYHLLSGQKEDVARMQGSKYVQSQAWRSYSEIMKSLKAGEKVLFSGTPCQVAAVKALTGDPENLVTVDLICHGVPPLQMLNDYLQILSKRLRGPIVGFRFRDKTCAKPFTASIDVRKGQKRKRIFIKASLLSYYRHFLNASIYRENCYSCPYACGKRVSDITIGDYWGIEKCHAEDFQSGQIPRRKDWSCVLVNTEKGADFLKEHGDQLFLHPSRLALVAQENRQLNKPSEKEKKRQQILAVYKDKGYNGVEATFLKASGGKLRFYWRLRRNIRENNRMSDKKV